jgi:putative ABC transport system substrate-binding protein
MVYGASVTESGRLAATLVNRILKGAQPGHLPGQQPTNYEFVINQTATQARGITISRDVAQEVTHWQH